MGQPCTHLLLRRCACAPCRVGQRSLTWPVTGAHGHSHCLVQRTRGCGKGGASGGGHAPVRHASPRVLSVFKKAVRSELDFVSMLGPKTARNGVGSHLLLFLRQFCNSLKCLNPKIIKIYDPSRNLNTSQTGNKKERRERLVVCGHDFIIGNDFNRRCGCGSRIPQGVHDAQTKTRTKTARFRRAHRVVHPIPHLPDVRTPGTR